MKSNTINNLEVEIFDNTGTMTKEKRETLLKWLDANLKIDDINNAFNNLNKCNKTTTYTGIAFQINGFNSVMSLDGIGHVIVITYEIELETNCKDCCGLVTYVFDKVLNRLTTSRTVLFTLEYWNKLNGVKQ